MNTVYVISGPLGVGKSSVAEKLTDLLTDAQLITGDDFFQATEDSDLSWQERLQDAWQNILSLAKTSIRTGMNVVVDFVVEDELPWLREQLSDFDITLKYAVLVADKKVILERLKKRDALKYKDRSLFLLEKLTNNPLNQKFLYDTTHKTIQDIAQTCINSPNFIVR